MRAHRNERGKSADLYWEDDYTFQIQDLTPKPKGHPMEKLLVNTSYTKEQSLSLKLIIKRRLSSGVFILKCVLS